MHSLIMPIKGSIDKTFLSFFLYSRCVCGVLFFFNGYKKQIRLEQVWQFQFQLQTVFSISFYESLKRGSVLL